MNICLTPQRVQRLAVSYFADVSFGSLSLEVERFNIFRGLVVKNIVIRSGDDFDNEKFFEMEKLVFTYSLFPILTGSVRIPEIGLYKPRIFLREKKGVWNYSSLMKPSEKKEEDSDKEEDGGGETSSEIRLPISVDFLMKFFLDDLCIYAKAEDFSSELKGLTFNVNIELPPFKTIPKSVEAVRLIKTMVFELNPSNTMDLNFYSPGAATSPQLILNWKLIFSNGEKPAFNSSLAFGAKNMPLRLKRKIFSPLDFMISYDIFLNPSSDSVEISDFTLNFKGSNWLKLNGSVQSVTKERILRIDVNESRIPLKDIYRYYVLMTGDRSTWFDGDVSICPVTIRGTTEKPDVKGSVFLKNVFFKTSGIDARVPLCQLDYYASGPVSQLGIGMAIKAPDVKYVVEGSKSGSNGIKLNAAATVSDSFKKFRLTSISLDYYDPVSGKSAINAALEGEAAMGSTVSGWIRLSKLVFNASVLEYMVPWRFRKQVASVSLKRPVRLWLFTNFCVGDSLVSSDFELSASVPDYQVEDLKFSASILDDKIKKRITINHITLGSMAMNFFFSLKGSVDLDQSRIADSDLKLALSLDNKGMKNIFGSWETSGMTKLYAAMKGDLETGVVKGNLVFDEFSLKNDGIMFGLYGLNMDFPFEYEIESGKEAKSHLEITQQQVIDSEYFRESANFTLKSFRFRHPARERQIEYIKDFSAVMNFRDNVFMIRDLKASVMDGSLYGRSVMFNLADFKTQNMEFNLVLDATNINIGRFDEPNPNKVIPKDSELSLSANFSGKGLNINKELTVSGYINIYEIGTDFANRLMKGLSQEKGKSKLGGPVQFVLDNSMIVEKFDFRLDKGLAYPTVKLKGKILSLLATVDKEEVKFDRIPVQEFLRKVTED